MWLLAHEITSSSHRSIFSSRHELERDRQSFIHQVAGLWIVNYGSVYWPIRFKLPWYNYGPVLAYGTDSRRATERLQQNLSKSQRSQCSLHMVWQSYLSHSVKQNGDTDDTKSSSLLATPIKSKQIFDMYFDTLFYWYWRRVPNIHCSSAFLEIRVKAVLSQKLPPEAPL